MSLAAVFATACGGTAPAEPGCDGVLVRGGCWVAQEGVTLSRERVERLMDVAVALWSPEVPVLPGWRIELSPRWVVVDGERYDGYTWRASRTIVVTSGSADCFERSALLHEMGHAWGHDHDDPRMSSEWAWIREAMSRSRWPGCAFEGDDDRVDPGAPLRTPP